MDNEKSAQEANTQDNKANKIGASTENADNDIDPTDKNAATTDTANVEPGNDDEDAGDTAGSDVENNANDEAAGTTGDSSDGNNALDTANTSEDSKKTAATSDNIVNESNDDSHIENTANVNAAEKNFRRNQADSNADNDQEGDGNQESDTNTAAGESAAEQQAGPSKARQTACTVGGVIAAAWHKRLKFSYAFYAIVFTLLTAASVVALQWSVYSEPTYAAGAEVDEATRAWESIAGQVTKFVSQIWLQHQYIALLNFLVLGLMYLVLIFLFNRFWIATAVFGTTMAVFSVANFVKVQARDEPIIPADLNFVSGGNTGELMSFIPDGYTPYVNQIIKLLIIGVVGCIILQFLDRRNGFFEFHYRRPFLKAKNVAAFAGRIVALVASASLLLSFTWNLNINDSWSKQFAQSMGDAPQLWNSMGDALNNGPAMNFLRLAHTEIMDKPEDYSEETMQEIAAKYADVAEMMNKTRDNNLSDNTVILLLSESFSDPARVPGITFSEDPMPFIRQLKTETTSGLMLSPGYGGGTANIEYQALTGLNMSNYDSSLSVAYQQLVPKQSWTPTFNQLWDDEDGTSNSVAFHSFDRNMYFRNDNYKKFGFSTFYAKDGDDQMSGLEALESAWYASDHSTYQNVLDQVRNNDGSEFVQVVTMQNHMPYDDWYQDNQFKAADTSQNISDSERVSIDTYAKGVSITDQETADFLAQLDAMDKPITVIFYGDHLPGIYSTAMGDPTNAAALHETDYFIWSNSASSSNVTKLDASNAGYTSSNYFMAQAAEHMNAKVSPYLAFLTQMHDAIPAISVPSAGAASGQKATYMDAEGNVVAEDDLSDEALQLLHDYELIQYDLSAGKNYLKDTDFMNL